MTLQNKRLTLWFVLLVGLLSFAFGTSFAIDTSPSNTASTVYKTVSPSVVAISVYQTRPEAGGQMMPFGRGNNAPAPYTQGGGSGFVIDKEGHIVTNAHVVDGAQRIEVNFVDGTKVRASVVGIDQSADIAVLRVDLPAEQLLPVAWGNSDALEIGQDVYAIGSPFGQRWTLTSGIISALNRTIEGLTTFSIGGVIQTDAAINPGNSGGPLLDSNGQVIGINAQIRSNTGSNTGIGYAIPSNLASRIAQELIDNGFVSYSYLGIRGGEVSLGVIEVLGLANNFTGIVVADVVGGSPAQRAGLKPASNPTTLDGLSVPQNVDIITAINGVPLNTMNDLIGYLATYTKPGDTVQLTVLRDGTETLTFDVRLTPRPNS
jgi:2-alkenal reductase